MVYGLALSLSTDLSFIHKWIEHVFIAGRDFKKLSVLKLECVFLAVVHASCCRLLGFLSKGTHCFYLVLFSFKTFVPMTRYRALKLEIVLVDLVNFFNPNFKARQFRTKTNLSRHFHNLFCCTKRIFERIWTHNSLFTVSKLFPL